MANLFTHFPPEITALLFGLIGIGVGRLIVCYADRFQREFLADPAENAQSSEPDATGDNESEQPPISAEDAEVTRSGEDPPAASEVGAALQDHLNAPSEMSPDSTGGEHGDELEPDGGDEMEHGSVDADESEPAPPRVYNRRLGAIPLVGSLSRNGSPLRLSRRNALLTEIGTGILFTIYVAAMLMYHCQHVEMVIPGKTWHYGRILYHLVLITLLIAATVTDLIDYVIPDEIPFVGVIFGVGLAVFSGELQMVHLWFDWNLADLPVDGSIQYGAYIPGWIKQHQHLHGLGWSLTGLVTGAGIIWLLRIVSSLLLGQESLGLGDVTLMAMVGSFIGWQPVCFVVLLAPLCGIVAGFAVKIISGRTFIAFGPYLCLSTFLVLCSWRWLWEPNRDIFGHPPTLAMLAAASLGSLIVLLLLLRLYRAIPVESHRKQK